MSDAARNTPRPTTGAEPAPTVLELSAALRAELAARVEAGYPHEVCGLLIGRLDGERVVVEQVVQAGNLNRERAHDRYQLDPADFLAADRAARAAGREVVGIWHSHPDHPARPSITDLEAAWEGYSYLIVAVERGSAADYRSWRLHGEVFLEERLAP